MLEEKPFKLYPEASMLLVDIPSLGNIVLALILMSTGYTFGVAVASARHPALLHPARKGAYATCAFVVLAVCLLAYAFQTHDFRVQYVTRYSDRSMPWWYLLTALWGGQDGSLLWWTFLLSVYTALCVRSLGHRYRELQPYIIATLMSIFFFFGVVMLFAANPFVTHYTAPPVDGEGLNPLLQNYWMTIHPPTLYLGFVGWSVPFAFVVAALVTGRLTDEWIRASRRWVLIAWTLLSMGNVLGMIWSYEELGWGGYWAWDPVENAAILPWFTGTAFLHSVMIQERRGMLKTWNVSLLLLTFILTIFGTFLTRSGLIASVHSFARSDIGIYFLGYLAVLTVLSFTLVIWRRRALRAENRMDSLLSREFSFLFQNWILLGIAFFVIVATLFPRISEWLRGETVTVGPGYYNKWMVPLGLVLLLLMGIGPLMAWRKATGKNLRKAFRWPLITGIAIGLLHVLLGPAMGFPPIVPSEEIYETLTGRWLAVIYSAAPLLSFSLCGFVMAALVQEFWRGTQIRHKNTKEPWVTAFFRLVSKARRRYGGYVVHAGIVLMYIGFTGAAYDHKQEATLKPGQSMEIKGYRLEYVRSRMESDPNKRMVFSDLKLSRHGKNLQQVSPAKFIYTTHPEMPTTEVAIRSRLSSDLYVVMNSVNPETKVGTFQVIYRPLVLWIWIGALVLLLGAVVAMWPTTRELLATDSDSGPTTRIARGVLGVTVVLLMLQGLAWPVQAQAQADSSSSLHAGTVEIHSPQEAKLFERLLCQCGECQRLPLSTCACSWAEDARAQVREELRGGMTVAKVQERYREKYGAKALAIPSDQGLDRALWAIPVLLMLAAIGVLWRLGRRWRKKQQSYLHEANPDATLESAAPLKYQHALNDELRRLGE
ncbi:MAG: cytochrome c biogenesis protein CcsA [Myxococcales bacterium]|nr:cytochrome c biogenesis protein CcsA [Myxococcales bacterium]